MSESVNVPTLEARQRLAEVYQLAVELGKRKMESKVLAEVALDAPVYGIFYEWAEGAEWLCDKDGIVFTFDFKDEAEAMRVLLETDGVKSEVRPYTGEQAARPYPWPSEELITV